MNMQVSNIIGLLVGGATDLRKVLDSVYGSQVGFFISLQFHMGGAGG